MTDLDSLTAELVRVVDETLQPDHVSIWLQDAATPHWRSQRETAGAGARNDV